MENTLKQGTTLQGKAYRYRIERVLGQGTFGITYLATTQVKVAGALGDLETTIQVAVKEFFMKDINGREESTVTTGSKGGVYANYKTKFAREAENLSRLRHPHIVRVLEYFEANNTVYYAMEYVDGGSLDTSIKQRNGLPEAESLALMEQIASAVSYMHAHKMLHLDLKPGNVMLRKDGNAVLIDFGLSKQYDEEGRPETSTSVGSGTPGYAPIEQANYREGKDFPVTMDVYSLGATLFKMLTNVSPLEASVILNDGFPAYELQKRGVSESTIACISRAMAPLKAQRYQSVAAFMDGLRSEGTVIDDDEKKKDEVRKKEEVKKEPPKVVKSGSSKVSKKGLLAVAIVAVVFGLVFLIPWIVSQTSQPENYSQETLSGEDSPSNDYFAAADSLASDSVAYVSDETAAVIAAAQQAEQERLAREEAERKRQEAEERRRREEAERRRQEEAERRRQEEAERQETASEQVSKGKEYYDNGNYAEAVKLWRKAAAQGNRYAQYNLGICYEYGNGVTQDYAESLRWYRKSADQGDADAQNKVGYFYTTAQGVSRDYAEAVRWYRKAADQGLAAAQYNLGLRYYSGQGVSQDYAEALKWFRKAADQEHDRAQNYIGECYYYGRGVSKDYAEATQWYRKSADQGYAFAQSNLGWCYAYGQGVTKDYAEAVRWFRKAADQGNASAQYSLGMRYYKGEGVTQDYAEALRWFRKSAEQGNEDAQNYIGECYYYGYGVAKDYAEAVRWYRKSADQGHASAQFSLGWCYAHGQGVTKDEDEAVRWYRKGAANGNSNAKEELDKLGLSY